MAKHTFYKLIPTVVGLLLPTYFTYDGYIKSTEPSHFELAAVKLGFTGYKKAGQDIRATEHQEALLKQLQIAGYFHPEKLWQDINRLGVKNTVITFKQIYPAIKKSKADQSDPSKFNAKILRKNLGKGTGLDEQDIMDFLFYTSQNAFGRKLGQERNELSSQDWMKKYEKEYLAGAKVLRLIDRETPEHQDYDSAWIAGASRIGVMARIIDYHNILSKCNIKVSGETEILTGERRLWANIDGITPIVRDKLLEAYKTKTDLDTLDISLPIGEDIARVTEGKEYIKGLAARYNIRLNESSPFIQYETKEECPLGYFPNRVYPNYAEGESRKLTETLMCQDLLTTYLLNDNKTITIVDTLAEQYQRPNTNSTARDAARKLVGRIIDGQYGDKKEFIILFETNNPYIERQTIATQREVNKVLKDYKLSNEGYSIKVEGVGFKCKQDVATIHSEFAALVAEKWKDAVEYQREEGISPKRSIEDLQFQTRDNAGFIPPLPDISEVSLSGNWLQDLFDEYLP
ncbi:MAG: hypothetical protein DMENIID0002_15190 [Rickettsia endosymbiont of Sergentomyia squamirostris]|uniref:Uncharacterized protein n=1 Tax=Candidatus Tisiphia endosymbiont of Sergentomyia squamirostris TaxID=3113639 RepID=A0AAT9GAJ4_9RICK